MSGRLDVVGIGPGEAALVTPAAHAALAEAQALYGYGPYLDRVPTHPGQARHASDNREEMDRAAAALDAASAGAHVAMVTGGDPGVFAMAAAVCEAIEHGPPAWRALEVRVHPGITAMLALAARAGAPLGHDFCAISLSDNLKPWEVVEQRLAAAAGAGFAIALYNPISRARPWQLGAAFACVARHLPPEVPVIFGHAVARAAEQVVITPLAEAATQPASMASCIIIGTRQTRVVARPGLPPLAYTPRRFSA
ncbi:precorrin-3B C(17)-methyltransferase [Roseococcus microcysteis]|uniref:precorrin-3B C(17)-methyltransferase n=1 Tax=Roseococcus microcysteis TaxID=2771361 RepID=UPI00168B518E|nr:precorrin-3B C(17)-methyltransferase [Roseococcus microcysteis]